MSMSKDPLRRKHDGRTETRDCFMDLMALDHIPASRVASAFKRVAACLGIEVEDDVDRRSARRIQKEGGLASKLQFAEAAKDAKGITLSGDGTSHKNEQYEARNATVITKEGDRLHFFLGIKMAVNHTSEAQLDGLVEVVEELYQLLHESGRATDADVREFWSLVTGFHSDHAEDQKKLFRLLKALKEKMEREVRGERVLKSRGYTEVFTLAFKCGQQVVEKAGGPAKWDVMSPTDRSRFYLEARAQLLRDIGQADFDALSEDEKADVDLFLWAGCAMHKDMNAFKGAAVGMEAFWEANGLQGPVQQPNRDNDATISLNPDSAAAKRVREKTKGGAVKLASNCGICFRHKDRKRGQQDTLRFHFDTRYGFNLCFPDTNNTRFQSHMEACAVLITYHDFFIEFLDYVRNNKQSRKLNHLEANIYKALHCNFTLHELCAVTMYYVAISVPYMRRIRSSKHSPSNALDLGPLHTELIAFIDKLIEDPSLIVGSDVSHLTGSFDGLPWSHPEAVLAVQQRLAALPHLRGLMVAMLKAARETWVRFSAEHAEGGEIARTNALQRLRAWMEKTNDFCESEFGIFRQASRKNPNLSLVVHNSREMYARNHTSAYIKQCSPAMRKFFRRMARLQDESGANIRHRREIVQVRKAAADKRAEKAENLAQKKRQRREKQALFVPILTVTESVHLASVALTTEGYMTLERINEQLQWLFEHGVSCVPKAINQRGKGRSERLTLWLQGVREYVESGAVRGPEVDLGDEGEEDEPEDEAAAILEALGNDESDGEDELYDSEEEWYEGDA